MAATAVEGKVFVLEAPHGAASRIAALVTGPHPYLWFGEEAGEFFVATSDTAQLRQLRDAITQALRHAL